MTTRPLGAQISHMLKDRGVDVIFGIPGVHNQEMYRGIEEAGITHVLARHEQGAGFMADGYARATGKPGVAYVITGPGLCNIMTPMGQAYSDSVPMLVISSCLDETASTRGQLHQMKDQEGAARAVCDWSETARTADAAYALIDRAFLEFETQRCRPKSIHVPITQLEAGAPRAVPSKEPAQPDDYREPPHEDVIHRRIIPDHLKPVAERLQNAKRPIFILGGGVADEGMRGAVGRMLERCQAAAFTSFAGRGLVADDYPLSFGSNLARADSADVVKSSDCVVVLGSDLAEVDLWRTVAGISPGAGVFVNTDPEVLAKADPNDLRVNCDAIDFVFFLNLALDKDPKAIWNASEVASKRAVWRAEINAERPGIVPVIDALKQALPADAMVFSDMTQFAYAALEIYPMDQPCHWHHPSGFGTLGYALPAAIGGCIGRRAESTDPTQDTGRVGETHAPTIAILGDYGFQYTVQELAVAVELELTLPIIIWDNGKLGEIEDSMVRAQIAPNAVVQRNPDFCKLAEAYGAAAIAPTDLPSFQQAVKDALATKGPTIIHVKSDIALTSS